MYVPCKIGGGCLHTNDNWWVVGSVGRCLPVLQPEEARRRRRRRDLWRLHCVLPSSGVPTIRATSKPSDRTERSFSRRRAPKRSRPVSTQENTRAASQHFHKSSRSTVTRRFPERDTIRALQFVLQSSPKRVSRVSFDVCQ